MAATATKAQLKQQLPPPEQKPNTPTDSSDDASGVRRTGRARVPSRRIQEYEKESIIPPLPVPSAKRPRPSADNETADDHVSPTATPPAENGSAEEPAAGKGAPQQSQQQSSAAARSIRSPTMSSPAKPSTTTASGSVPPLLTAGAKKMRVDVAAMQQQQQQQQQQASRAEETDANKTFDGASSDIPFSASATRVITLPISFGKSSSTEQQQQQQMAPLASSTASPTNTTAATGPAVRKIRQPVVIRSPSQRRAAAGGGEAGGSALTVDDANDILAQSARISKIEQDNPLTEQMIVRSSASADRELDAADQQHLPPDSRKREQRVMDTIGAVVEEGRLSAAGGGQSDQYLDRADAMEHIMMSSAVVASEPQATTTTTEQHTTLVSTSRLQPTQTQQPDDDEATLYVREHQPRISESALDDPKRRFACQLCGQRFTHACHLKAHMRIHTGARPFMCHVCDKTFTMRGHLTYHMRIHSGEQPFECPLCDYKGKQSSHLELHMRQRHKQSHYACTMPGCAEVFGTLAKLAKHCHKMHDAVIDDSERVAAEQELQEYRQFAGEIVSNTESGVMFAKQPRLPCPYCGRKYANNNYLNRHVREMHEPICVQRIVSQEDDEDVNILDNEDSLMGVEAGRLHESLLNTSAPAELVSTRFGTKKPRRARKSAAAMEQQRTVVSADDGVAAQQQGADEQGGAGKVVYVMQDAAGSAKQLVGCPYCDKMFSTSEHLDAHFMQEHLPADDDDTEQADQASVQQFVAEQAVAAAEEEADGSIAWCEPAIVGGGAQHSDTTEAAGMSKVEASNSGTDAAEATGQSASTAKADSDETDQPDEAEEAPQQKAGSPAAAAPAAAAAKLKKKTGDEEIEVD